MKNVIECFKYLLVAAVSCLYALAETQLTYSLISILLFARIENNCILYIVNYIKLYSIFEYNKMTIFNNICSFAGYTIQ